MNTTSTTLTLSAQDKDLRKSTPTDVGRCHDTLNADRCQRDLGHDGAHKNGHHVWNTRNVPVPPWMKNLRAKELRDGAA